MTCDGIELGPFILTCFGLSVAVAAVVGSLVTAWMARRRGENPLVVFNLFCWMLLIGVVCARLFYVLDPPPSVVALYDRGWYLAHPLDLQVGPLAIWSGGMSMVGMMFGAVLGALLVVRRQQLDVWMWADISVPGLLLILIVVPWGNMLMGQMLGPPTELPWGITVAYSVSAFDNLASSSSGLLLHPTPAYFSLWALMVLFATWGASGFAPENLVQGDLFLGASLLYGMGVFLIAFLHADVNKVLLELSMMQVSALGIMLWSIGILMGRRLRHGGMNREGRIRSSARKS